MSEAKIGQIRQFRDNGKLYIVKEKYFGADAQEDDCDFRIVWLHETSRENILFKTYIESDELICEV